MSIKADKINSIIDELKTKRINIEQLEQRSKVVIDAIETKLLTYLTKAVNLPSVATITPITESLNSLYNTNLSANAQIIRSMEKEVELLAKHGPDDQGNVPEALSYDVLGKLFQQTLNREVEDFTNEEEDDE